ncbi:MAG: VWA domain-containing protein [Bacteroidia bacterium]
MMILRSGILVLLAGILFPLINLPARPAPITAEMMAAFNQYPDYINLRVHDLSLLHRHLEQFNVELNQYYSSRFENPSGENFRNSPPVFAGKDICQNINMSRDLAHASRFFSPSEAAAIRAHLEEMEQIWNRLRGIPGRFEAFSLNADSYTEDQVREMYLVLDEAGIMFEDFNITKSNLYFELEKIYKNYQAPDRLSPWVTAAGELKNLVSLSFRALQAVRVEDARTLTEILAETERALGSAMVHQKTFFRNTRPGSEKGQSPAGLYAEIIAQARAISALSREYLSDPVVDPFYEKLGKAYYYFNFRYVLNYSAEGQGLVYQYNRFLSLSDQPMLRSVAEVNTFRAMPPDSHPVDFAGRNLVFLLDISGSMDRPEKLPLFRREFVLLLSQLSPTDKVSIVTYSGYADVVLPLTLAAQKQEIVSALQRVEVKGQSKPDEGFVLAFKEAEKGFRDKGDNRVILISDGGFEISQAMKTLVAGRSVGGISLDAYYFGQNEPVVKSRLMHLAKLGNGHYAPIPSGGAENLLKRYIIGE